MVPSLPSKVTFIQRKRQDVLPLAPFPPSACSSVLQGLNPVWGEVADQPLSDEVSNMERHLLSGSVGGGLPVSQSALVFCHHVNSHTHMAKVFTMTDSVDTVSPLGGKVIGDD